VTDYLNFDDLLEIADGIVERVQVRDLGLLASAAARPQMSVYGEDAYPTLVDKAAALMHSIARNRALIDDNLRLAWAATRVFLIMNNADLAYEIDDAKHLVLGVARGELDVPDLAADFSRHLR
jgi:death-on-curing protein